MLPLESNLIFVDRIGFENKLVKKWGDQAYRSFNHGKGLCVSLL